MAAPITAYLHKCLNSKDNGATKRILLAKPLSSYTEGSTDAAEQVLKFKDVFYIDIIALTSGDDGKIGMAAFVKDGGENAMHHNLGTRASSIRSFFNNEEYILLNDAGLNTRGDAQVEGIVDLGAEPESETLPDVGEITIWYNIRAPWYSDVTVIIEQNTTNGWVPITQGKIYPAKFSGSDSVNRWVSERGLVKFRAVAMNSEGTVYGQEVSQTIRAVHLDVDYNASTDLNSAWSNKAELEGGVFIETSAIEFSPESSSTQLFINEDCTELAPNGTYFIEDYYYVQGWSAAVGRYQIIASGQVSTIPSHPDYDTSSDLDNISIEEYSANITLADRVNMWWEIGDIYVIVYNNNTSAKTVILSAELEGVMSGSSTLLGGSITVPAESSEIVMIHKDTGSRVQTESNELFAVVEYSIENMSTTARQTIDLSINNEK